MTLLRLRTQFHCSPPGSCDRSRSDYPPQPEEPRRFVLGQSALTVNQAVEEVCTYLGKRIFFRIPLSLGLANIIIKLFRIEMAAWDRFCMQYRHFTYSHPINPGSFHLPNYCVTMADVLKTSGVKTSNHS